MKCPVATLTLVCALLALPPIAHAKGGGHGGGGHGGGHSAGGHHGAGGSTSSGSHAAHRASASHRSAPDTTAKPRHRPGVGQPLTGTAVPRRPLPVTPPVGGGVGLLPSLPLFGLSGGFGFSSYADWPIVGADSSLAADATGGLRLQIDPPFAEVIIDGYYRGLADEFRGRRHALQLTPGSHHVELRAPGYEPLNFDLMTQARHTIRFAMTLVPSAP